MQELNQFTGTENYFSFNPIFGKHVITDGVKYLAEKAQCYWLLDAIASYHGTIIKKLPNSISFQVWRLVVNKSKGKLQLVENEKVLIEQKIKYTDFPMDKIVLYVAQSGANQFVIMLPSEY